MRVNNPGELTKTLQLSYLTILEYPQMALMSYLQNQIQHRKL